MYWMVAAWIVGFVLAATLMRQKTPQMPGMQPSDDVDAPVAEEGKSIAVLFGVRDLKGPNVVWYGDLKSVAIRKKGGKK